MLHPLLQWLLISKVLSKNKKPIRKTPFISYSYNTTNPYFPTSYKLCIQLINLYRKVKITKATFCMFDIIMKRDVRVEIAIPGGTHVFAMDESQNKL